MEIDEHMDRTEKWRMLLNVAVEEFLEESMGRFPDTAEMRDFAIIGHVIHDGTATENDDEGEPEDEDAEYESFPYWCSSDLKSVQFAMFRFAQHQAIMDQD